METKQNINKQRLGERLFFLNHAVKELQAEIGRDPQNPNNPVLRARVKELYELKVQVLVKLLAEGHIAVGCTHLGNREYYSFRLNGMFRFHMPKTREVREAVQKYGRNRTDKSK